jgi:hypothetical protein
MSTMTSKIVTITWTSSKYQEMRRGEGSTHGGNSADDGHYYACNGGDDSVDATADCAEDGTLRVEGLERG